MATVVIQHIVTTWDKKARGGKLAVQRNAVADVAKIPVERLDNAEPAVLQQELRYGSHNFTVPYEKIATDPVNRPFVIGCVTADYSPDLVFAAFRYTSACCGAPMRVWAQTVQKISQGEWGQLIYNGRFTGEDYWWYEKHVVNVGLFEHISSDVFTRCVPNYRFEALGMLI